MDLNDDNSLDLYGDQTGTLGVELWIQTGTDTAVLADLRQWNSSSQVRDWNGNLIGTVGVTYGDQDVPAELGLLILEFDATLAAALAADAGDAPSRTFYWDVRCQSTLDAQVIHPVERAELRWAPGVTEGA